MKTLPKWISRLLIMAIILCQVNYVYGLDINASSAILIDANTGQTLYEKNSEVQRAMASTTKIMTYLLTMEAIDEGKIALSDRVKVSRNATKAGGSSYKLRENDVLTVSELINSMMIISANDSAVVLAEYISGNVDSFVAKMNDKAKSLGLSSAYFVNPNGMPLANQNQNKISAKDLALLSRHVLSKYEGHLINITSQKQFYGTYKTFTKNNTNELLRTTSFTDGLKTGYTDLAMYCLVSTTKVNDSNDNRIISVVLGGKSSRGRFDDSQKMLEYGLKNSEATLVPLGKTANQLGVEIMWEPVTKTITGKKDDISFVLTINSNQAIINGNQIELDTAPIIIRGTTMVPIQFIAESLGIDDANLAP